MSTPPILLWDQAYNRSGDPKVPRTVVNVIRTYMDTYTLTGFVKAETLANATGMQIRGVRKQIAANVAAGWLEVLESGNSSGKANNYRLAYPKGVLQDTITTAEDAPSKGVLQDTIDRGTDPQRVSYRTPLGAEGCPTGPVKGVLQDTPTSPRTSPQEKFLEGTTQPEGVLQDTLARADPQGSATGIDPPIEITSESNRVPQDTLGIWASPGDRLLAALADGPINPKHAQGITGLQGEANTTLVLGLIAEGRVIHDRDDPDRPRLRLPG